MAIRAIQRSGRAVEVILGEAVTANDVALVRDALARGPRGAHVTLDVRHAHSDPVTLLALARVLSGAGARFSFLGLTSTNQRLLQYLAPA